MTDVAVSPSVFEGELPKVSPFIPSSPLNSHMKKNVYTAFLVVKNLSANAEDTGLIPDPGRPHIPRSN